MTESGSSSQSPTPNLPGGAKKEDRPDFKVIRSAPPPESGPNLMPILLLVGVLALGVGGYALTQRKTDDADKKGAPKATTEGAAPAGPPAPDFIMEKIGFYENEGRLQQALTYAQEKLADYPDAPNLRAKIRELRGKLGQDVVTNPDDALRQAAARIQAGQLQEALDGLDALVGGDLTLTDPQRARASFLLAMAHGGLGNSLDARNALETAASLGHDAGEIARLREKLGL